MKKPILLIDINNRNYLFILFLIYLFANGGILFIPNAIYWDDWSLYHIEPSVISDTFRQVGSMFNYSAIIHNALLLLGPFSYKYLTFILMFGSGYMLDLILRKDFGVNFDKRFIILTLFLILPLNIARVTLITFPYTLCYFFFFLAWYLINRNKTFSLIFFFISFNTNSLLVFYLLPLVGIYYQNYKAFNIKFLKEFIKSNFIFICIPVLYFVIKTIFYKPYGIYNNYNSIIGIDYFKNIINSIKILASEFTLILSEKINITFFIFIFSYLIFVYIYRVHYQKKFLSGKSISLIFIGSGAILLALFPYLILGLAPTFQEWSSRHQLLLPLGTSLLLVGALSFFRYQFRLFLLIFIIITSITINTTNYIALYQDWNKQKELIALFKNNEDIKKAGIVGFIDETKSLNAIHRAYRIYEWNGLMKAAFGNEIRFGVEGAGFQWARDRGSNRDFVNASNNNKDFINDDKRPSLIVRILPVNSSENFYKAIMNTNSVKIEVEHPAP